MIHTKGKQKLLLYNVEEVFYVLPGVSGWHLKWNFRKLCQHLFNLSSCETSSISHNPLSSHYCCWISSCRLCCKMKLHFWCQASSNTNVVKLTIFYKEHFIQFRIHLWILLHCMLEVNSVCIGLMMCNILIQQSLHSSKTYQIVSLLSSISTCILLLTTKTEADL